MNKNNAPILSVKNLTKVFKRHGQPDFIAVNDVSFDVMNGECLGIIGESGSGKTTVANMIARFIDATSGSITLFGEDITHAKGESLKNVWRKMQMVFQMPMESFDPRMKLGESIGESLVNSGMSAGDVKNEVTRLLSLVGLSAEFYPRYPHEVSGGQCQRAAIARAIAIRPAMLICDEATSALDVTVQSEVIALLRRLIHEMDMTCLFICHDIAFVQHFCDSAIVMQHGKIVERGKPGDIVRNPQDDYTKMLIDSVL